MKTLTIFMLISSVMSTGRKHTETPISSISGA